MTVLNVTNATLKGAIKGPTFDGDVDGSTFTGAVTYTDTTEPPIEPPPTSNEGRIENFVPAGKFTVGGVGVNTQNAKKAWSLTKIDDYAMRFEHRIGDLWTDGDSTFRTELSWAPHWNEGESWRMKFKLTVLPGTFANDWMVLNQIHDTLGTGNSPPYGIELNNDEKLRVVLRFQKPGQSQVTQTAWSDPNKIQRDREYVFEVQIKFAQSDGFMKVWRDGTQIVNYSGPLGFAGSQYYYKSGIYRSKNSSGTMATTYRNMVLERM